MIKIDRVVVFLNNGTMGWFMTIACGIYCSYSLALT